MLPAIQKIKNAISGERAFYLVREISNFHRIQASTGYRAAAKWVCARLQAEGLDARIRSFPANGDTWFFTSKMFQEWDCQAAGLNLVSPARCLADFNTNNLSVIQKSYPCDYRDQPLEIVLLDKGSDPGQYEGLDLKGKLVFVREHVSAYLDWAVKERGALGFITDYMRPIPDVRSRYDLLDTLNYISFWWKHTPDEPKTFGFVLTPREGDRLAQLCRDTAQAHEKDPAKDPYPRATCYIQSRLYDGEIEVVETVLPGETDEEVLIVAHLCHPRSSANDNASGVAASMEVVKVLKDLTTSGQLPPLQRSVRLIFVPEFTGTYAYLHGLGEHRRQIRLGLNLDMVGARQVKGYGPITISGVPHATPSFCLDLAALVLDEVKKNAASLTQDPNVPMFNSAVMGFEGGSDHLVLSDPTINIPTPMLGQWPDLTYHSSGDTMEVIDPFILHKSAAICAGYIYTAANLSPEDVLLIMNKTRERFVASLNNITQSAVNKETSLEAALAEFQHLLGHAKAGNDTYLNFFAANPERARVARCVSRENQLLDDLAAGLWCRFIEEFAPHFSMTAPEIPEPYRYVPQRTFTAPLYHLDDYALNDPQKMAEYKAFIKGPHAGLRASGTFDPVVQFYIDGKRTLWEIATQTMLETHDGSVELVHEYVQLLKSFGLVEIKEPE
ncbi:MAG TPA: DUF4910 domain-containing protein [Anaerolineaceae bacterium]|nr:DUF4910 domain-containing protein [Anaerolineaceae bacterium]HPN50100.1 DUF4910 domain-containing protein [Anaerolineaceae bacterium]